MTDGQNPKIIGATSKPPSLMHPGQYVRDKFLTSRSMSVKAAADLVGVSRPALSNFLNGKVATSQEMASRIERAFGLPAQKLLDMQVAYDATQTKARAPANTKAYVPPFLIIRANDIETWASQNISARARLSVLLRTLVHSTGLGLKKVDFPGNDDSQRPGWDGFVETTEGTPWIPDGTSGWEFGVNANIKGKADDDFAKSVKAIKEADRSVMTFVFVTPRRWTGKAAWITEMKAKGLWKDVRAYDASDLEQWLEQSLSGQAWFANETVRPSEGVRSLDQCWSDWANATSPPLVADLFDTAIAAAKRTAASRLSKEPEGPTIIAADSVEEALAFLSQLFSDKGGEELALHRDRVLVFDKPGTLPRLAQGAQNFIPVAFTRDVEREMAPLARSVHTIIVYPRNAAPDPHIVLEPLSHEAFGSALEGMGFNRDDIARYSNASGRSLTVLRRQLSTTPAVRKPEWAVDHATAGKLIPFLLAGAWNSHNEADQTVLTLLADDEPYEALEKECQRLAQINDAPLWSVGTYRGVISKIDLLFAIAGSITVQDLTRYFDTAKIVLGEDDPSLDLPESARWAASIYGKSREISAALREGISETLVLLAVHGNHLFKSRLGIDAEALAARFIRDLLTPLTLRTLEAHDRDLPTYAEVAPEEFLAILERDLRSEQSAAVGLMRPVNTDTGFFGGCPRTGLLWALEGLAWNPDTLPRSALILAQLAEVEISDNWVNKPINSLLSIFRVWMPQTAASHDVRLNVIKLLAEKYPAVAWKICIEQLNTGDKFGDYSHKPRWRTDGYGFGEPFTEGEPVLVFMREMVGMVLGWKSHSREMLCDLIEHLHDLSEGDQTRVWELILSWANAEASDSDKAIVREKIRVTVMSRRGLKRSKEANFASLTKAAKVAYQALEPTDLITKYEWLFRTQWVDESADELLDESMDFQLREERIKQLRIEALREIMQQRGLPGILELASMGKASSTIGSLLAGNILPETEMHDLLLMALPSAVSEKSGGRKDLIAGALWSVTDKTKRVDVLKSIKRHISESDMVQLLLLAPFCRSTWQVVEELEETHQQIYWNEVPVGWPFDSDEENRDAIDRLLAAQRPRAAFAFIRRRLEAVPTSILFQVLSGCLKEGKDQPGHYQLDQYHLEEAFGLIDKDPELTLEQKASLEFSFIDALARPGSRRKSSGIPNLERYIEAHPEFFVRAIVWRYKRRDRDDDPQEWRVDPETAEHFAEKAYKLLDSIKRIPGHNDLGEFDSSLLVKWVKSVRDACSELSRSEIGDVCLGKLFSCAPVGQDGIWPCEPVRSVMEDIQSESISEGAYTGLYNARGVHWRGEGGDQERELARKYRTWANALHYSHPFVASTVLTSLAKTYEDQASREDAEAGIRRRLR
ncbi:HigA family addiction module antitoxin [Microvirga sp. ACRRW]|uniref:HigA family addiction module antitoxin n=1 Tax=Microvirga sp. ACRRW TaxID=2918205 RepID=UPI001EF4000E|nr:HigA family addiction module antitoxin [Microvirga sp. ACRRW]MCG7391965.1 HigA family addiction module antitoxin [Microvirga sp. ACRRW]